jgi:purine-binding chemotaxis protein CheW
MDKNKSITNQFLTFLLGGETYAIEITKIREILTYPQVTILPNTPDWVKGVINLRGEVTPIIDLRLRFNTSGTDTLEYSDTTIVIAVVTSDNRMLGIVVDEVSDIELIDLDTLAPSPDMGISIGREYLKGLYNRDDDMVVVANIDKILEKSELGIPLE